MWDEQLDQAIDEVAREMTAAEAPELRRAVMARIAAHGGVRRSAFAVRRSAFVLTPIAVAAAIVTAVFVTRAPQTPISSVPDRPAVVSVRPPANGSAKPATPPESITPPRLAEARARQPRAEAEPETAPNDVASIAVAPLTVAPINPDPIPLDRLDAVTPITVAPLDINDSSRRNQ